MASQKEIIERLDNVEDLLSQGKWEESIECCIKLIDISLTEKYNILFHYLSPTIQMEIIQELNVKKKRFGDLMFGDKIRIFKKNDILALDKSIVFNTVANFENIFAINQLRVESTHPTKTDKKFEDITRGLAYYCYGVSLEFMNALNMLPANVKCSESQVFNNLPLSDVVEFIGREHQVQEVLDALLNNRYPIVSIDGIGGVGKSTLAIECARKLAQKCLFSGIIWVSAKKEKLTPEGIKDVENSFENLDDLFNVVLKAFNENSFIEYNFDAKKKKVIDLLKDNSCLLVIDNLETIEDQNLKRFLIDDVPSSTKTLITSRERLGELEKVVILREFSLEETSKYLFSQLKHRGYLEPLSEATIKQLHSMTGGIPLALKISIPWILEGKLKTGISEDRVFGKSDILKFCFEKVFNDFLDENARTLFLIISISPNDATESALKFISGCSEEDFGTALNALIKYSMIVPIKSPEKVDAVFSMLPLTQLFGRKLVEEKHQQLKSKVNQQYLKYFSITSDEKTSAKRALSLTKAEEAMRMARAGDENKADALFREALHYERDNDYALYLYAIFSKERQDYGKASDLILHAISLQKENPTYWIEYGNILEQTSDFKKAERTLEDALKYCGNDLRVTQRLVVIKERLGKIEEAMNLAEKSIDPKPKDSKQTFLNTLFVVAILEGSWRLGYNLRQSQPEKTLSCFINGLNRIEKYRKVILTYNGRLQFHEKKILRTIAEIYREKGDKANAINYYRKAWYEDDFSYERKQHNSFIKKAINELGTPST